MNIMAGSCGGIMPPVDFGKLNIISVAINNICNLRCRHCYLEPILTEPALSPAEWSKFFESVFSDLKPKVVAFAGKEVFADKISFGIMTDAIKQRNLLQPKFSDRTRIGVITNGTLVHRYQAQLIENPPDWIDVSIDGIPECHDAIRGVSAFDNLEQNIRWLVTNLRERVWVTHTLMEHNVERFAEFVSTMNCRYGLGQFSIGTYRPLSYTDQRISIVNREQRIIDAIGQLSRISLQSPVNIQIDCDYGDGLKSSLHEQGVLLEGWPIAQNIRQFGNGLCMTIRAMQLPVGLWRAVRVSTEGLWLAAEDLVEAKKYGERAIGSLRDFDFDSVRLHSAGINHSRFQQLIGMSPDAFFGQLN